MKLIKSNAIPIKRDGEGGYYINNDCSYSCYKTNDNEYIFGFLSFPRGFINYLDSKKIKYQIKDNKDIIIKSPYIYEID